LLSIGAGLVAQIPSLLVAVASGLLVTRAASTGDRALGEDLAGQLAGSPRALVGVAALLLLLGLVPGLPHVPFIVLALVAGVTASLVARRRPAIPTLDEPGTDSVRGTRVSLRLAVAVYDQWQPEPEKLHHVLGEIRGRILRETGVPLPALRIVRDALLAEREVCVALDETPVAWTSLGADGALERELTSSLVGLVPELIDVDRTAALVERAATTAPVVVREVVPRVIALPVLAEVLRSLARDRVPVGDLAAILEAIAVAPAPQGGFTAKDVPALVDTLRGNLRRQISARWAPRGQLAVYTVDAMIEDAVRTAIDRRDGAQILALEPAIAQDIVTAVRTKLGDKPGVILASGDIRRHLRSLLEPELPEVAVLAAHELAPGTAITTAGRIDVT
jgi:type III secretion protein V